MSISLFYVPSLTAKATICGNPWEARKDEIPQECILDKNQRQEWQRESGRHWAFYSPYEGVVSTARLSEENPPHSIRAFVADFDARHSADELDEAVNCIPHLPSLVEWSLTPGHLRAIWVLDEPLLVPPHLSTVGKFADLVLRDKLMADKFGRGRDVGASSTATRLFAVGQGEPLGVAEEDGTPARLPKTLVQGWLMEFLKRNRVNSEGKEDRGITPEMVAPALAAKYPRFAQWPGEFKDGASGPTFWLDESKSPASARVHPGGIYTFSATAAAQGRCWWSWSDLLDVSELDALKAERRQNAVRDIYFDGHEYHVWQEEASRWASLDRDALKIHLRSARGVAGEKKKGETASEMDECLDYIHRFQRVRGAAPFLFRGSRIVKVHGEDYLNTGRKRVMCPPPGEHSGVWGDGFPNVANLFEHLFDCHTTEEDGTPRELNPEERKRFFIALVWICIWVHCCRDLEPRPGQALIIAGGTNRGKTLFSRCVLATIMGGFSEGSEFLKGEDRFGAEVFESPLLAVDDGSMGDDYVQSREFTNRVKAFVANPTARYHAKFKQASVVNTEAMRIVITINDNENSLINAPIPDKSNLDKMMLFRCSGRKMDFADRAELIKTLEEETPAFLQFILSLDWRGFAAEGVDYDSRYGVQSYKDPQLVRMIMSVGHLGGMCRALRKGREYFYKENPGQKMVFSTEDFLTYLQQSVPDLRNFTSGSRGASEYTKWNQFLIRYGEIFPNEISHEKVGEDNLLLWTFHKL